MTTAADLLRPEPERDQWGRYKIAPANGGKAIGHTRVTTFAKSIADTYNLTEWAKRNVALGMAKRPDLVAMAHGLSHDDKAAMREVVEAAEEASGANERRRIGTALHSMCERVDLGLMTIDDVPEAQRADVAAYLAARDAAGLGIVAEHVERTCVIPQYTLAGTYDRLYLIDGRLYVGDLKTGTRVDYGAAEIAIQLACYGNAETTFDFATHTHSPMPEVDRERAVVVHVPAGEARCELHWIDIAAGWEACQLAAEVRTWRKRKNLLTSFTKITGTAPALPQGDAHEAVGGSTDAGRAGSSLPERHQWVLDRVAKLVIFEESQTRLARVWPEGVPTFRQAREAGTLHNADELDQIIAVLDQVEAEFEIPFGPNDPTAVVIDSAFGRTRSIVEGPDVGPADIDTLKASVAALDAAAKTAVEKWSGEANAAGTPFAVRERPTLRRHTIATAAVTLAAWDVDDDAVRTAIGAALGTDVQPAVAVGHALGSLTRAEATTLLDIATRLCAGAAITFDDTGTPVVAA